MTLSAKIDQLSSELAERDRRITELSTRLDRTCGCVTCICENDEKCQGCGAKNCDLHESYYRQRDTATRELSTANDRISELENLRDRVCLLHETSARELTEAKAEITRLREAIGWAHNAMQTWFSSEYLNHPETIRVGVARYAKPQKGGDTSCPSCEQTTSRVSNAAHDTSEPSVERREHYRSDYDNLAELLASVTAERDQLKAENEKLRATAELMRSALSYWLPVNAAVNKLPIGNFYLPETEAGFMCVVEEQASAELKGKQP